MPTKKPLHPKLRENSERLKRGEPLHSKRNAPTSAGAPPARPKIRSAKARKG